MSLLSINADAKTRKGMKLGVLTGILYMAPADIGGYEVCKYRTPGCTAACLYTAGRGRMTPVQKARIAKKTMFFEDRSMFWSVLIKDIEGLVKKAAKENLEPAIRLNGTSDLPWERIPVVVNGELIADSIMTLFPNVQFYDYTKWPVSRRVNLPSNYHLTFSLAENNDADADEAIANKVSVAVVFDVKKGSPMPMIWNGWPVVDGDVSDVRYNDPKGWIVGLRAKGMAGKDKTGFVRNFENA